MTRILTYIFSGCLLVSVAAPAQIKPAKSATPTDTVGKKALAAPAEPAKPAFKDSTYYLQGGIRIGLDLSRFVIKFFQPYRTDIVINGDARIKKNLYAAMEIGYNNTSHSDTAYDYKGNGFFATIGVDYNFLKKLDPQEHHMFYGGIRYGFGHMTYEAPRYVINDPYWGKVNSSYPKTNAMVHWVELIVGLRTEVLKNLYLGWNIRQRLRVSNSAPSDFPPIVMPGYGSGSKKSQFDMQYSISYLLPLWRLKQHVQIELPKSKK
ncbi:hypothetical protein KTO58_26790 [Chitinophaga pendula]|uniref:DUF6048 family protein n=1 Tax=Chitinophaga TaxID=79328 RepID=UPI000BAF7EE8|nr:MULTISPECIES: DUF6048 family protein [Chitinophaga]ASZ09831.1 hypothetical protein CK934_01975 [Chitinophaga sp. MD30]UCJ07227.1 hypothetical protein KTO58_26790 [Chitinophaga pendula]